MRSPEIELLWWEGCPSTERAAEELREALRELDLDEDAFALREIRTEADAHAAGFAGSPTILIDGRDVAPVEGENPGLSCRVYHRRDGTISPVPDPEDLRDALRRAVREQVAR